LRSRQESHGRVVAPSRPLPLHFLRPLPGLRFERWRLGCHPRWGSTARPHCPASCSRVWIPAALERPRRRRLPQPSPSSREPTAAARCVWGWVCLL
jgi:hypothetical protein